MNSEHHPLQAESGDLESSFLLLGATIYRIWSKAKLTI